jgi:hypothetical protein
MPPTSANNPRDFTTAYRPYSQRRVLDGLPATSWAPTRRRSRALQEVGKVGSPNCEQDLNVGSVKDGIEYDRSFVRPRRPERRTASSARLTPFRIRTVQAQLPLL